jgi:hypothetical protein
MNKRRLLKLADLLEADAANKKGVKFDLNDWAKPADGRRFFEGDERVPVSCNTSACAMGLAAISGAFKRSGLKYELQENVWTGGFSLVPTFNGKSGFDAAEALFEISSLTAEYLFDSDYYAKSRGAHAELAVAARIRKLVAGGNIGADATKAMRSKYAA